MNKAAILAVSAGIIASIIGVVINNPILIVLGPVLSLVLFLFSYMEISSRRRKVILPEEKYETVLSIKQKHKLNKKRILTVFISIVCAVMVFVFISFLLNNYLYAPSSLSIENVINAGCRELNKGTGECEADPSTIIVDHDVDGDGKKGGDGDTLAALLEKQNCTGECLRNRCACLE
ncbi:MAG: hypothetical protein GTN36_04970 [Candidatus Aenigmarchaeota archaeon]|nr:hypothetical protein [Candidatus Aenigmarchaeota archaeon]